MINWILFIVLGTLWGGSFVVIPTVIDRVPPVFGAGLRVWIGTIALVAILACSRKSFRLPFRYLLPVWGIGLFVQGIPFSLLFYGEQQVSPGLAGIINGTTPIWTFILGTLFLPTLETFTTRKGIGLCLGFSGIAAIFLPKAFVGTSLGEWICTGAILVMAICYAIGTLANRFLFSRRKEITLSATLFHQHCSSGLYLLVVSFLLERPMAPFLASIGSVELWGATLYLGVGSTAIAMLIYFRLLKAWGAVRASSVGYVIPIAALSFDQVVNGRSPDWTEILGVGLILFGVSLIQWPARKIVSTVPHSSETLPLSRCASPIKVESEPTHAKAC